MILIAHAVRDFVQNVCDSWVLEKIGRVDIVFATRFCQVLAGDVSCQFYVFAQEPALDGEYEWTG